MCGRFTLTTEVTELQKALDLSKIPADIKPRYNIAPSQQVAVVNDSLERSVIWMRWGLIPFWAKNEKIGYKLINARAETISIKPAFQKAFRSRRCLILADGFFEWQQIGVNQQKSIPYYIHLKDRETFAFAGIWDEWSNPAGGVVRSCSIITCEANQKLQFIHARMPVIFDRHVMWNWLIAHDDDELLEYLKPYPNENIIVYEVSKAVNAPSKDYPDLVKPMYSNL